MLAAQVDGDVLQSAFPPDVLRQPEPPQQLQHAPVLRQDERVQPVYATLASRRLAAKRSTAKRVTFDTNVHSLAPGVVTAIADHPRPDITDAAGTSFAPMLEALEESTQRAARLYLQIRGMRDSA